MPAITYSDFSGGLDRRLPIDVQEANRLWQLKNAFITQGKRIKKRPGLKVVEDVTGTVGLAAANGRLKTFVSIGAVVSGPQVATDVVALEDPPLSMGQSLKRIYSATMFNGYLYVVADYGPEAVYGGGGKAYFPRDPLPGASL